jgi:hypothetical protein
MRIPLLQLSRRDRVTRAALAERVLGCDLLRGYAEKPQDHRGDQPGAVLARDTVKHCRHGAWLDEGTEEDRQAAGAVSEDLPVAQDREVRARGISPVPHCEIGHHVDQRQVKVPHPMTGQIQSAPLLDFAGSTEVDDRRDAEGFESLMIIIGQARESV